MLSHLVADLPFFLESCFDLFLLEFYVRSLIEKTGQLFDVTGIFLVQTVLA